MAILALDYGKRHVGCALATANTVAELPVIHWQKDFELRSAVTELIKEYDVKKIVIGLPTYGKMTEKVQQFAKSLENILPVELYDESLSTMQAQREMQQFGGGKGRDDSVAARLTLEAYLAHKTI